MCVPILGANLLYVRPIGGDCHTPIYQGVVRTEGGVSSFENPQEATTTARRMRGQRALEGLRTSFQRENRRIWSLSQLKTSGVGGCHALALSQKHLLRFVLRLLRAIGFTRGTAVVQCFPSIP